MLITEDAKKEAKEFLESLTREELIELLEDAGFEVDRNGRGKVIFTDYEIEIKPTFKFK